MSDEKIHLSDEQWRARLTPEQYAVCRRGGTEPPFTGALLNEKRPGTYHCVCCGAPLFASEAKFDSGSGWPSFNAPVSETALVTALDLSHGMRRQEIRCARCDAHLGHVFPDGPPPTGLRFCVNSVCLDFRPASEEVGEQGGAP